MGWPSESTRLTVAEDALQEIANRIGVIRRTSSVSQSLGDQMDQIERIAKTALVFSDKSACG